MEYTLKADEDAIDRVLNTNFYSTSFPLQDQYYYRGYKNKNNNLDQDLSLTLGDFSSWLFGNSRRLSNYTILLKNDLAVVLQHINNVINDKDTSNNNYVLNPYLSNRGNHSVVSETPNLNIGRTFMNILANRFQKSITVDINGRLQFYAESNSSDHAFLNYTRNFQKFIPSVSMAYRNFRFGNYMDNYELDYIKSSEYPDLMQLYPLVDSSSVYNIRYGNPGLKPSNTNELLFKFRHDDYRSKNTFNYGFTLRASLTDNYFADSAIVDQTGRYSYYTVNLNGNRHVHASFFLNKAIKSGDQQYQLSLMPHIDVFRNPGFINYKINNNAVLNFSNTVGNTDTLSMSYTYRDILAINISEILSYFRSTQSGLANTRFSNNLNTTKIGVGATPVKKLLVHSSISYNTSKSTGLPTTTFTLWNADASYRFLENNSLEVKISALDILHQNRGILNYGSNYSLTHESINVLQQYFMLTVSYFPRKFGKKQTTR